MINIILVKCILTYKDNCNAIKRTLLLQFSAASFTPNNDTESDDDSQESEDSIQPPLQRRRVDQTPVTPSIGQKQSQPVHLLTPSMTTISSPTTTHTVQQPTQTSGPSVTTITSPTTKIQTRQQQSQPVHVPPSATLSISSSTTKHTHGNIHRKRQRVISTCISTTSTPEWTSLCPTPFFEKHHKSVSI